MLPYVIANFLEIVSIFIFGIYFEHRFGDYGVYTSKIVIYFIVGVLIFSLTPRKIVSLAVFYTIIFSFALIYPSYINHGHVIEIMGEDIIQQFKVGPQIATVVGLFLGLFGGIKSEENSGING